MKQNKKAEINKVDLIKSRKFIMDLISQAGLILKKYYTSGNYTQKSKGGLDIVTQADLEVDSFLLQGIKKQYPFSNFLTEETAPDDYSAYINKPNLWIIDPLDGTVNFSRNIPHFAISIALVDKGVTKLAVTHDPLTNNTYYAESDKKGAYLDNKPIQVSRTQNPQEAVLACDWAWGLDRRKNVVRWIDNTYSQVRQIKSMGSAVSDLASLAAGKIDAYIHSGLHPWDTAASALLIEKAGGKITTPTGKKWNPFEPDILATNGILHDKILKLIKK